MYDIQVGTKPGGIEIPRSLVDLEMQKKMRAMPKDRQPIIPTGPDLRSQYMWRVGPRPSKTRFQELNSEPVIPEGFPEWKKIMDSWGFKLLSTVEVGTKPGGIEIPRSLVDLEMQKKMRAMPKDRQPIIPTGPDLRSQYMWRVGPRPSKTRFQELNSEPVIPEGFPEWKKIMDSWGFKLLSTVEAVAEMAAIGFDLPKDSFTNLMKLGPHLLGPTGSDLVSHGEKGAVFAGYHYDINFLTIHYKSRFPGLSIWLRNGEKVEVKVPDGCLLIQAGKELEYLTAGDCMAGMHEVVVTDSTLRAIEAAKKENRSLWRVSSTLFSNVASDAVLKPLGHFAKSPLAENYPPLFAGDYFEKELLVINLKEKDGA
ncbi:2-oxoglutarate (2OG) and Fe(II)-dependent oxygenase superfamily protein [Artemisia annua]|uniref:2-oxoglutarate (2OG) and Fe(II)-dependent oxygenase superfamily protein n=1 Tax=Artemisia annua TaxID=35608 RepID=A0A2U1K8X2_ARTAN|nr:2-oxoglutarate (2OG) and Fe(II)-dependent oxygenase superfamily protein [Artemisia annua]